MTDASQGDDWTEAWDRDRYGLPHQRAGPVHGSAMSTRLKEQGMFRKGAEPGTPASRKESCFPSPGMATAGHVSDAGRARELSVG